MHCPEDKVVFAELVEAQHLEEQQLAQQIGLPGLRIKQDRGVLKHTPLLPATERRHMVLQRNTLWNLSEYAEPA